VKYKNLHFELKKASMSSVVRAVKARWLALYAF
jgi:hypothetical protein